MITLGVDLAAQPPSTAVAVLDGNRLVLLELGSDDGRILDLARDIPIGIDAPLGWPDAFVDRVTRHHAGDRPRAEPPDPRDLQLRLTDRWVHEHTGKRPLSVSTDRIGVVALRAIGLLDRLRGPGAARDGSAGVYETYPGGAVAVWELTTASYKRPGDEGRAQRRRIVDVLARHLDLDGTGTGGGEFPEFMVDSDDALDAVLCAALAGLAVRGRTPQPSATQLDRARREGWIHIPAGPVEDLADLARPPTNGT